jgi:hypothetical protein
MTDVQVEESMENLEEVVRERNRAYYELETGTTGRHHIRNFFQRFRRQHFQIFACPRFT